MLKDQISDNELFVYVNARKLLNTLQIFALGNGIRLYIYIYIYIIRIT